MKTYQYFIDTDQEGEITELFRIVRDQDGLTGEYFFKGSWIEHPPLTDVLIGSIIAKEISKEEAEKIGQSWGWNIHTS